MVKIDPEFKNVIPPLLPEEHAKLAADIKIHGCIDPLVIWKETGILLDGHHRYEICGEEIPYNTTVLSFESREDAILWVINHQLGRRNITKEQRDYLIGAEYEHSKMRDAERAEKAVQAREQYKEDSSCTQNEREIEDTRNKTAKEVGKKHNIGQATVRRDQKFYKAVSWIQKDNPEFAQNVLNGQTSIKKEDWDTFGGLPDDEKPEYFEQLRNGKSIRAIKKEKEEEREAKQREATRDISKEVLTPADIRIEEPCKPSDISITYGYAGLGAETNPESEKAKYQETKEDMQVEVNTLFTFEGKDAKAILAQWEARYGENCSNWLPMIKEVLQAGFEERMSKFEKEFEARKNPQCGKHKPDAFGK